jgi:predicted esterase
VDGAPLGFLEYLPPGYGDGASRPLLIFLHGSGEAGDGSESALALIDKNGIPQLIAAGDWPADQPFVVLSPQYGTVPAEGKCGIAADVAAFLAFAIQHYEVDAAHVYLTGISCGAIGIWDYLAANSDEVVSAVVSVSGHAQWALEKDGCQPLATVPVWAFHGALDDVVPVEYVGGHVDQIQACDTVEPADVDLAQSFAGIELAIPILASAMDAVVDARLAGELARLGGLAILNLEGVQARYDEPDAVLARIATARDEQVQDLLGEAYAAPVREELVARRIEEIRAAGSKVAVAATPGAARRFGPFCAEHGADLFLVETASYVEAAGIRARYLAAADSRCPSIDRRRAHRHARD